LRKESGKYILKINPTKRFHVVTNFPIELERKSIVKPRGGYVEYPGYNGSKHKNIDKFTNADEAK
jgi:hypothetical protein